MARVDPATTARRAATTAARAARAARAANRAGDVIECARQRRRAAGADLRALQAAHASITDEAAWREAHRANRLAHGWAWWEGGRKPAAT